MSRDVTDAATDDVDGLLPVTSLIVCVVGVALRRDIQARGRVSRMLRRPDEKRSITDGFESVWCSSRSRDRSGLVGSATVTRCGDFDAGLASSFFGRNSPAEVRLLLALCDDDVTGCLVVSVALLFAVLLTSRFRVDETGDGVTSIRLQKAKQQQEPSNR